MSRAGKGSEWLEKAIKSQSYFLRSRQDIVQFLRHIEATTEIGWPAAINDRNIEAWVKHGYVFKNPNGPGRCKVAMRVEQSNGYAISVRALNDFVWGAWGIRLPAFETAASQA